MKGFCSSSLPGLAHQGDEWSEVKETGYKCSQNISLILGNAQHLKWSGTERIWKPELYFQKPLSTDSGMQVTSTTELASSGLPESSEVPVFHGDGAITGPLYTAGVEDGYSSPLCQGTPRLWAAW